MYSCFSETLPIVQLTHWVTSPLHAALPIFDFYPVFESICIGSLMCFTGIFLISLVIISGVTLLGFVYFYEIFVLA